jgi:hypothetical protein
MNHLAEEQFEDLIQGNISPPAHFDQCPDCQNRLTEKKAIAQRLRLAFDSVQVDPSLTGKIQDQLRHTPVSSTTSAPAQTPQTPHTRRRFWPGLAAAAAFLVVAIPLAIYLTSTPPVQAAQAELYKIHQQNLNPQDEFFVDDDPGALAEFFRTNLGFTPALPRRDQGLEIRGCCVAHFQEKIVGSYVVETPQGFISIIVVTDTPQILGMAKMDDRTESGEMLWKGSFARCHMVTVRIGDYSYCAVGEVSSEILADLLNRLLS